MHSLGEPGSDCLMGHTFDQWEAESDGWILPTQAHGRLARDAFYVFSWRTVPQDQAPSHTLWQLT